MCYVVVDARERPQQTAGKTADTSERRQIDTLERQQRWNMDKLYLLNLNLFGEEPVEAAAESSEAEAEVVYGNPPDESAAQPNAAETPDYDAEFEKLIKGDYREAYDKRVQGFVKDRFKRADAAEKQLLSTQKLIDALSLRYGKDPGDHDGILAAFDADEGYLEQQSMQSGMSLDAYKEHQRLQRDSAELQRMRQSQQAQADLNNWIQEATGLQASYPGLDVLSEINNPATGGRFLGILRSGGSVEDAYFMVHKEEILGGAMQTTAQKVAEKVTNDIRTRGMRPAENGAGGNAPAKLYKNDPSQWDDNDLDRVQKMLLSGKKVEI